MMLVDTHCHLYLKDFEQDVSTAISNAATKGVNKIVLPAIDSESHESLLRLVEKSENDDISETRLYAMMGLHPCSVKEDYKAELEIVEKHFDSHKNLVAVGEIGLDYYWDTTFKTQQQEVFDYQIALSVKKNLPIAIHSRSSTTDCIEMVNRYKGSAKGIFHCFSGSEEEAKRIIDLGFFLGIGGVVTYKNTNLRNIIKLVGLSNVVLETDAPYLSPVPYRGKRNEPANLPIIADTIATTLQISMEEVAQITYNNAASIFSFR
jgi:TatD DNase family protein